MRDIWYWFVLCICLIVIAGCNSKQESSQAGGHDGHNHEVGATASLSRTIVDKGFEVYTTFAPLSINTPNLITVYVTRTNPYRPVVDARVVVSFVKGKSGIRNTAEKPVDPGLYETSLAPSDTGEYIMMIGLVFSNQEYSLDAGPVQVYGSPEEAASEAVPLPAGLIAFAKTEAWKVDFGVERIRPMEFNDVIKTTGSILPAQGDEVMVTATHSGQVVFANKSLMEGFEISKGQSLFALSTLDMTHDNIDVKYNNAVISLDKAKADYERSEKLLTEKIISQKEFQETEAVYMLAKNEMDNIKANYTKGGQQISSPENGFVKSIYVSEGEFVETGQPLVRIAKNKKLIIKAEVGQKHFGKLAGIYSANFTTPYNKKTYCVDSLNGKLISYGKNTEENSFYTPVYFEVDNRGDLISGSLIEVYLLSDSRPNVITVPVSALLEEQGDYYLFVQRDGEHYEKRYVVLGATDGQRFEIKEGLKSDEVIVTSGAYRVKLASLSGSLPDSHAGHSH